MESHGFDAFLNENSSLLILGSFPSVTSRKKGFYYMHPQNRFWPLLCVLFKDENFLSDDILKKKQALALHRIALYDVVLSCNIQQSADESIKNITLFPFDEIITKSSIQKIICNGKKSFDLFDKYFSYSSVPYFYLPSTSPRNASYSLDDLISSWRKVIISD